MLSAYRVELGTRVKKKSLLRKARAAKCFCHLLVSSQSAAAVEDRGCVKGQRQVLCTSQQLCGCKAGTS